MKKHLKYGFTIVELLIVIVVIGILVAITVISFTNITAKGNLSSAQSAANQVLKKAETYSKEPTTMGSTGTYPVTLAVLTGATSDKSYQVSGVSYGSLASAPSSPSTVKLQVCGVTNLTTNATSYATLGAGSFLTGVRVYYWDYSTGAVTTSPYTSGITESSTNRIIPGGTATVNCYDTGS